MAMIKRFELTEVKKVDGSKSVNCESCSTIVSMSSDTLKCPNCGELISESREEPNVRN